MYEKSDGPRLAGKTGQARGKKRKFDTTKKFGVKKRRLDVDQEEINSLDQRVQTFTLSNDVKTFQDFPLSKKTLNGLERGKYAAPTKIQLVTIGLALKKDNNDKFMNVVASAKTGSGKTLAFVIPVLDRLFRLKWSTVDGLGALVISPTRELAMQTYLVFQAFKDFFPEMSFFPVFGEKDKKGKKKDGSQRKKMERVKEERCIGRQNVVIATPGRLLELMHSNPTFNLDNIQILVLDEADRVLDPTFKEDVDSILDCVLPLEPQILLFSATQTKSVKDLKRCGLTNRNYVTVDTNSQQKTPKTLQELYMVCELSEKIDTLWSIIRSHLKEKLIVFFSTRKQVRFFYQAFCRLQPGTIILMVNGDMKQSKRMYMTQQFRQKQYAILFTTDVASRGLDFPAVDTVVQVDCPATIEDYVHRVGRTARHTAKGTAKGKSVLILLPSEEDSFIEKLKKVSPNVEKIQVHRKKMTSIQQRIDHLCAEDIELNDFARKAHLHYLKSLSFSNMDVLLKLTDEEHQLFARSYGMAQAPKNNLTKRVDALKLKRKEKNSSAAEKNSSHSTSEVNDGTDSSEEMSEGECGDKSTTEKKTKKRQVATYQFHDDSDSEEEIFKVKRKVEGGDAENILGSTCNGESVLFEEPVIGSRNKVLSKVALAKKALKKNLQLSEHKRWDDDGEIIKDPRRHTQLIDNTVDEQRGGIDINEAKKNMEQEDKYDKDVYQQKIKAKKNVKKLKEKEARRAKSQNREANEENEYLCQLGSGGEDSDDNEKSDQEDQPNTSKQLKKKGKKKKEVQKKKSQMDDNSFDSCDMSMDSCDDSAEKKGKKKVLKKKSQMGNMSKDSFDVSIDSCNDGVEKPVKKTKRKVQKKGSNMSIMSVGDDVFDTGLSLQDDVAIALKLLANC